MLRLLTIPHRSHNNRRDLNEESRDSMPERYHHGGHGDGQHDQEWTEQHGPPEKESSQAEQARTAPPWV